MVNIQIIKMGNIINYSINGVLKKFIGENQEKSKEFYNILQIAKENPTKENLLTIDIFLNPNARTAMVAGLETDIRNGEVYLCGFNTPIPQELVDIILDYHNNGYPMHPIMNFWKLLMLNPDKRIRETLFNFIKTHDFVLTDNGYMIVYKAVYTKDDVVKHSNIDYKNNVNYYYNHVKKDWKCNPKKYILYQNKDNVYKIGKSDTVSKWNVDDMGVKIFGNLSDLYNTLKSEDNTTEDQIIYTDMHTKTMSIELGKLVEIERKECDGDPSISCSYGLHVGATKYVSTFANNNSTILACYVNPMDVVAVPRYDHSKMRVCKYFPFAKVDYNDNKISIIEQKYFEDDYKDIEINILEEMIDKIKKEQLPIQDAINCSKENRNLDELKEIIKLRMLDLNN